RQPLLGQRPWDFGTPDGREPFFAVDVERRIEHGRSQRRSICGGHRADQAEPEKEQQERNFAPYHERPMLAEVVHWFTQGSRKSARKWLLRLADEKACQLSSFRPDFLHCHSQ